MYIQKAGDENSCSRHSLDKVRDSVSAARTRRDLGQQEIERLETTLRQLRNTAVSSASNAHHAQWQEKLQSVEKELASSKSTHANALRSLTILEGALDLHGRYLSKSEKDNACLFCGREFAGEGEVAAMRTLVDRKISLFTTEMDKLKDRLAKAQNNLQSAEKSHEIAQKDVWKANLDGNGGKADTGTAITTLENRMVEAQGRIDAARTELESLTSKVAESESAVKNTENRLTKLNVLRSQVANFERSLATLEETRRRLQTAEAKMLAATGSASKGCSLESLRDERTSLMSERETLEQREVEFNKMRRASEEKIISARNRVAELSTRCSGAEVAAQALIGLRQRLTEANERRESVANNGCDANELEAARTRLANVRSERRTEISRIQAKEEVLRGALRDLKGDLNSLQDWSREEQNLSKLVSLASNSRDMLSRLENANDLASKKVEELSNALEEAKASLQRGTELRQSIVANIELRRKETILKDLDKEEEFLRKETGGSDRNSVTRVIDSLRSRAAEVQNERGRIEGEAKAQAKFKQQIEYELTNNVQYNGVENKHKEAVIALETEQLLVNDLARYHQALDVALMRFHSKKMEEINRTIRELWIAVYRGFDIDYIAIRSSAGDATDEDGNLIPASAPSTASGGASRSYNYRVVLVRQGVELDMRGRCSAGQKMIASIIIRLALAESFGVNCGILALDEPTTNLDKVNVEGLARALGEIIVARRGNSGFQLILITHDEEFVRQLARMHLCEQYVQVAKDADGKSTIRMADIRNF
eukprot:GDKJ01028409.1.p1 GENE.GDKJ01028409.1~~GDKJ01028409.1.p1  ORF type:complete len:815 (-),score=196.27 GDKJ01028409.1:34-2352(-)